MIREWLAQRNLAREALYIRAYSDHVSDAPMLEFADEAWATNPHPPLARLAAQRGWKQVHWI
jgi:phosphoserine phosphatase